TDLDRRDWAVALASITGLSAGALLASRARRVQGRQPVPSVAPSFSESADRLLVSMERSSGRALPPSEPALRNWKLAMKRRAEEAAERDHRRLLPKRIALEAMAFSAALFDRRVPWYARAAAVALVAIYLLVPWDPIPDRIPYIGHLDDAVVAGLAMLGFLSLVPSEVLKSLRREARVRLGGSAEALQPLK
ncbi:MAG TPA: YkvA family protein, partial [Stellaceae bacterium]|nr:YkvA family protein [Stellaceae bacterium]